MTKIIDEKQDKFWNWSIIKQIFKKSLPMILGAMLNAFIPFIDNIFAGTLGDVVVASVSYSLTIYFTCYLMILGITGAISVIFSQYLGSEDSQKIKDAHKLKILSSTFFGIIFGLILFIFASQLIGLFSSNKDIIDQGQSFLRVYALVIILVPIVLSYTGSLAQMGKTNFALILSIVAVSLNGITDWLFVSVFNLKIAGLAWATVIVNVIQIVTILTYVIISNLVIKFSIWTFFKIEKVVIVKSLKRWHMVFTEVLAGFVMTVLASIVARAYDLSDGNSIAAGSVLGIISPFQTIFFAAIGGFYAAIAFFVSTNLGKNKFELAYQNMKRIIVLSLMLTIFISGLFAILAPFLVALFTSISAGVAHQATMILRLYVLIMPFLVAGILAYRFLEAGGQTEVVMVFDFVYSWVYSIVYYIIIYNVWHPDNLWLAYILANSIFIIRATVGMILVFEKLWIVNLTTSEAKKPHGLTLIILNIVTLGLYGLVEHIRLIYQKKSKKNSV